MEGHEREPKRTEKTCYAGRSMTMTGDHSMDPLGSARLAALRSRYLNRTKPDPIGLGTGSGSGFPG